jgi:hypothetical protein
MGATYQGLAILAAVCTLRTYVFAANDPIGFPEPRLNALGESYWQQVVQPDAKPKGRAHHVSAAVVVEGGPQQLGMGYLIHGGCTEPTCAKPLADAWLMQPVRPMQALPWRQVAHEGAQLGPRGRHAATIDRMDDSVFYVFGGTKGGADVQNDLWQFIGAQGGIWLEKKTTAAKRPPPRMDHAMMYAYGQVFIFGGHAGNLTVLGDTWAFDNDGAHGHKNEWKKIALAGGPLPRYLPLWVEYLDRGRPSALLHGG